MRVFVIMGARFWGLLALLEATDAGIGCFSQFFLIVGGLALGIAWVIQTCLRPELLRTRSWYWLSGPAIGFAGVVMTMTHAGLTVRVWLCESELRAHAEAVRQNPEAFERTGHHPVGLFRVRYTRVEPDEVTYITSDSGFLDSAGIAYRPDGRPPQSHWRHDYLFGQWWWIWQKF